MDLTRVKKCISEALKNSSWIGEATIVCILTHTRSSQLNNQKLPRESNFSPLIFFFPFFAVSFHKNWHFFTTILSFSLWQKGILIKIGQKLVKPRKNKFSAKKPFYQYTYNVQCTYNHLGFSSEIEVPQLGSEPFQLGKFQLKLITNIYLYWNYLPEIGTQLDLEVNPIN